MTERKGGMETVKKVEIGGGLVVIASLLASIPILGVVGLLAVTGAEGYKQYKKSRK